eukprot:1696058-Alexandrium_andersonii.AAC.1
MPRLKTNLVLPCALLQVPLRSIRDSRRATQAHVLMRARACTSRAHVQACAQARVRALWRT